MLSSGFVDCSKGISEGLDAALPEGRVDDTLGIAFGVAVLAEDEASDASGIESLVVGVIVGGGNGGGGAGRLM